MLPPAKRKGVATASERLSASSPQQRGIKAFGKISKSHFAVTRESGLKRKLEPEDYNDRSGLPNISGEKRHSNANEEILRKHQDATTNDSHNKSSLSPPRKKACTRPSSTETVKQGASSSLDFSRKTLSRTKPSAEPKQLAPLSFSQVESDSRDLPEELQDLVDLHSSLLTALSLYYVHNGPRTPADLRIICPSVAKTWRRRRVTEEDVRRILSFHREGEGHSTSKRPQRTLFDLADYGLGKICIELADTATQKGHRRPLHEEALNNRFLSNLLEQWDKFKATTTSRPPSLATFITSLPLCPITPSASLTKVAPLFSKGQTRLLYLNSTAKKAQSRALTPTTVNILPPLRLPTKPKDAFSRSSELKSRIFAKQLHRSTLPAPLSPETAARRSALQRLPEIAPVLESLALSAQKHCNDDVFEMARQAQRCVSFTMPTLVQNLQMSLRNPISKEDAVRCVRLLGECVPEWVGVREIGKVVGVTVRGIGVGRVELARRVDLEVGKV
ncbi:MAG: hypothetical protein Q9217_004648 [Psora testacea]